MQLFCLSNQLDTRLYTNHGDQDGRGINPFTDTKVIPELLVLHIFIYKLSLEISLLDVWIWWHGHLIILSWKTFKPSWLSFLQSETISMYLYLLFLGVLLNKQSSSSPLLSAGEFICYLKVFQLILPSLTFVQSWKLK